MSKLYKVVVLGAAKTVKTTLISQLQENNSVRSYNTTSEIQAFTKDFCWDNVSEGKLQVWYAESDEQLYDLHIKDANAIVVVIDPYMDKKNSEKCLKECRKIMDRYDMSNVTVVLVVNKSDPIALELKWKDLYTLKDKINGEIVFEGTTKTHDLANDVFNYVYRSLYFHNKDHKSKNMNSSVVSRFFSGSSHELEELEPLLGDEESAHTRKFFFCR